MESSLVQPAHAAEMIQKTHNLSFLGRRSFVPRPLSEATEILDSDFEDDDEENSPISDDSVSTLSDSDGLATPPGTSSGLAGFNFQFAEAPVAGPHGPHLFRSASTSSSQDDLFISMSPVDDAPKTPRQGFTSLRTAVADLDPAKVQSWTPRQVADWMTEAGFESSVVEKFLIHDICGTVLLDLEFDDLKELDISSFGKRRKVMSSIQLLRNSVFIAAPSRPSSTRTTRRSPRLNADVVPEESVSIVAIEQLLPKQHSCEKGEACQKWQKQQFKIAMLEEEFANDIQNLGAPSVIAPSVAASSDALGPATLPSFTLTAELLHEVQRRDAQENIRQFLGFQHVNSPTVEESSAGSEEHTATQQRLNGLPKLRIPSQVMPDTPGFRTPMSALRNPTSAHVRSRAELERDPFHYGGIASPVDVYRLGTPASVTDIPITAMPIDPCQREVSQSVPPEMRFGNTATTGGTGTALGRSHSTKSARRHRQPSFAPSLTPVRDSSALPIVKPIVNEERLANHAGWMKKKTNTRLLRQEWQDKYLTLEGSKLDVHENDLKILSNEQSIDVDAYTVHAYSTASTSKLSAAFKKVGGSSEPSFAFSLIPDEQKAKKLFEKDRSHHFAVNSGKDRVEWMRKLMLAKAMKKNQGQI